MDPETAIFLIAESALALLLLILAGLSWLLGTTYDSQFALSQTKLLLVAAAWPAWLFLRAASSGLLRSPQRTCGPIDPTDPGDHSGQAEDIVAAEELAHV